MAERLLFENIAGGKAREVYYFKNMVDGTLSGCARKNAGRDEILLSVLKKLLRREFGRSKYESYSQAIRAGLQRRETDGKEVYDDIYENLRQKDRKAILKMRERLDESMLTAFRISKSYGTVFAVYLASFLVLVVFTTASVAVPFLLFISALFLMKTWEFASNRFCYIDVHIVLIYHNVLEHLLAAEREAAGRKDAANGNGV